MSQITKQEIVNKIFGFDLTTQGVETLKPSVQSGAKSYAPVNFALIKYWGKDPEFEQVMLPLTDSFSVAMGDGLGTHTKISLHDQDEVILNDQVVAKDNKFNQRLINFVDLFRPEGFPLKIETTNTVATAAGLASSASGFAALVLAMNEFFGWDLEKKELSILARLGSGSASRSVYDQGFVQFRRGNDADTMDSYAIQNLDTLDFCVGILSVGTGEKKVSSGDGMKQTVKESFLYQSGWKAQVENDLADIKQAIKAGNFDAMGRVAQRNALAMHATAISAGVIYWNAETLKHIQQIIEWQNAGHSIYFTEDAGPHLKILTPDEKTLRQFYPDIPSYKPF